VAPSFPALTILAGPLPRPMMIERLLKVENASEAREIVIHVNMLKEGRTCDIFFACYLPPKVVKLKRVTSLQNLHQEEC